MMRKMRLRLVQETNRGICVFICMCHVAMILNCISLVYLTIFMYVPSIRMFKSGFEPVPVMCQTVYSVIQNDGKNCTWSSCSEWCLTKPTNFCPQINVTVRRTGPDIFLEGCSNQDVIYYSMSDAASYSYDAFLNATEVNVILLYKDNNIYVAKCNEVFIYNIYSNEEESVELYNTTNVIISSCYQVSHEDSSVRATDCTVGVIFELSQLLEINNFSAIWNILTNNNNNSPIDPILWLIPNQKDLTIYNSSRLYVNVEGCVNTLRHECKEFYDSYSKIENNSIVPLQFPCYYHQDDSSSVLEKYDLKKTRKELLIACVIPPCLFLVSVITICAINRYVKVVKIGDDTRIICQCCEE